MKEKEHQSIEWKESWQDEYLKWICGYANAYGGTLYIDTSFSPDGKYKGIKALRGIDGTGKHGLPESSHSSTAYLKMNPDGTFNMMRIYDHNHNLRLEIAYHVDDQLGSGKILHYHIYDTSFSQLAKGKPDRTTGIRVHKNSKVYKRYKKYFKGVSI